MTGSAKAILWASVHGYMTGAAASRGLEVSVSDAKSDPCRDAVLVRVLVSGKEYQVVLDNEIAAMGDAAAIRDAAKAACAAIVSSATEER
jgi:hypothetical protein